MWGHALHVTGAILAAFVSAALLLARGTQENAVAPHDTLAVGLEAEVRSLDPHTTTAATDFRVISSLYEGLVQFSPRSLDVVPALAERWEISEDGLQYRFRLKPGVRFHDGTPCDARAVRASFERMLNAESPYRDTGPFPLGFFFERVRRIETPDRLTVIMHLDAPFGPLLANLAHPAASIVSEAALSRHGRALGRNPVGTGPFRLARWDAGGRVTLTRFADYHAQPARLRHVVFRPIEDAMTRAAELRAGGLDVVSELPADNVRWFRGHPGFRVVETEGPHLWFVMLDLRHPALRDVRVRRALNYAVNKRELVEHLLQGTASVPAGPFAPGFARTMRDDERPYPYDPERARALLAEAGFADGLALTLHAPQAGAGMLSPVAMATAMQADLARVGVRVTVQTHEWNSYLDRVNAGLGPGMEMAEMAWMTHDPDTLPYLALRSQAQPPHGFNSGYYANPRVDRWMEQARRETDPTRRRALYREVQRQVHADAPWIFVASWKQSAVTRSDVIGFVTEPSFRLRLADVSKRP